MMQKHYLLCFLILFLASCTEPKPYEVTEKIKKTDEYIKKNAIDAAYESIKQAEDNFNLIHTKYAKKDRDQLEQLFTEIEMDLSASKTSASKVHLSEISTLWHKMNR